MQQELCAFDEIPRCFSGKECFIRPLQQVAVGIFASHFCARMVELVDTQDLKS